MDPRVVKQLYFRNGNAVSAPGDPFPVETSITIKKPWNILWFPWKPSWFLWSLLIFSLEMVKQLWFRNGNAVSPPQQNDEDHENNDILLLLWRILHDNHKRFHGFPWFSSNPLHPGAAWFEINRHIYVAGTQFRKCSRNHGNDYIFTIIVKNFS